MNTCAVPGIGGAGNDNIWGDLTTTNVWRDWSVERQVEENEGSIRYKPIISQVAAAYPAGGDDIIFGGAGDDFIDGGADNDVAFGFEGDDQILGGAGNDSVWRIAA